MGLVGVIPMGRHCRIQYGGSPGVPLPHNGQTIHMPLSQGIKIQFPIQAYLKQWRSLCVLRLALSRRAGALKVVAFGTLHPSRAPHLQRKEPRTKSSEPQIVR
jgi:hypothetical protein